MNKFLGVGGFICGVAWILYCLLVDVNPQTFLVAQAVLVGVSLCLSGLSLLGPGAIQNWLSGYSLGPFPTGNSSTEME